MNKRSNNGNDQGTGNNTQRNGNTNLWYGVDWLAAVDEGHRVLVHGMKNKLDANESKNHCKAIVQEDQLLQKTVNEEEELTKTK